MIDVTEWCAYTGHSLGLAQGWGWLTSLYRGPVKKMLDLPRPRLQMVPPPVSPQQVARALQYQNA